jgi:integrase
LLPSFGLRITAADSRTYFVMARVGQGKARRLRRFTVGNAKLVDLAGARAKARDILCRIDEGEDPGRRDAPMPGTFGDFAVDYLSRRKPSLRASTYAEYQRLLSANVVPRWSDLPVDAIKQQDLVALLDDMAGRGAAVSANRLLALLKTVFRDASRRGLIAVSPAVQLQMPTREKSRERALSDEEISLFWSAAERIGLFGSFFQMLLLTGQRRGQTSGMSWAEVDLNARTWTIPGTRMKGGREHQVALSDLAVRILMEIKDTVAKRTVLQDSPWVWSIDGRRPIAGFSKPKRQLDRLMQEAAGKTTVQPWRLHDLRRTLVHGLASMGTAPHVADRILAHSQGVLRGVSGVYNKFAYLDARRDALCAWGRKVAGGGTMWCRCPSAKSPSENFDRGLQSFRSMRRMEASLGKASAVRLRFSQSLAKRRQRLSQAMVRSSAAAGSWADSATGSRCSGYTSPR